jgi:ornithine--oxo-acid transaminase
MDKKKHLDTIKSLGAQHYKPLPIVLRHAKGCWMTDIEGIEYLDMLSAYSAINQGHRHPRIIQAAKQQLDQITLCSTAFNHDKVAPLYEKLHQLTGFQKSLLMNSGAEAVETAIKLARKWGYEKKGVPQDQAEIIVFENNFHGRTTTIVSFSSEEKYRKPFGPFTPGFKIVPYNNPKACHEAFTPNTVGVLVEPIQGEGGINIPDDNFIPWLKTMCNTYNMLLIADEIQTGLGRTGKFFAMNHYNITPDILILGKALSGGTYPVSAVCSDYLDLFQPGEHGSTYGANPLACAIALESLNVLIDENLSTCAKNLGEYLIQQLNTIKNPAIKDIRGKGLLIGVELNQPARPYCEKLMQSRILCKETHENVIRFAPPLVISKAEIDWAIPKIKQTLSENNQ